MGEEDNDLTKNTIGNRILDQIDLGYVAIKENNNCKSLV